MMTPELDIIGTGDHARVILDTARALGVAVRTLVEPDHAREVVDRVGLVPVQRGIDPEQAPGTRFIVAVGDNRTRLRLYQRMLAVGAQPMTLVHPTALTLDGAIIGTGSHICAGAVVGVGATVGDNVIVNTRASLDHDVMIADHAFVGPGAVLAGRVRVGEGAHVGIGSTIIEGRTIGDWSLVAAGAVVIGDVGAHTRVAGIPAREMRRHRSTIQEDA
jgi:acetyltransferase EpsM